MVDGAARRGHLVPGDRLSLVEENLRHEFHPGDTRVVFRFSDGARLEILWEPDDDGEKPPALCTFQLKGVTLTTPTEVRRAFPQMGVVPVLTPVDLTEQILSVDHLRANVERPLTSRHARNHLHQLALQPSDDHRNGFLEFCDFAQPWISELQLRGMETHLDEDNRECLDLYYSEPGGRHPKEIFWAGDGMQIWVQLLYHVYRLRDADVIVLDEPDLFLHADMQRRLVSLLESIPAQVVTATHSPEVLAEAHPDSVVWVSRNRKRAVRAPAPELLSGLTSALGTQFNLRLARALRAKAVVFVEGDDTKILRELARTTGAESIAAERELVTIPLKGFDRWQGVEAFSWMLGDFLDRSVTTWVLLDRDYRNIELVAKIEAKLKRAGATSHVWARHELENYLASAPALARLTGADEPWIEAAIDAAIDDLREDVLAGLSREIARKETKAKRDVGKVAIAAQREFKTVWTDRTARLQIAPGKELLSGLRRRLQDAGFDAVTDRAISKAMTRTEIPLELRRVLGAIDRSVRD